MLASPMFTSLALSFVGIDNAFARALAIMSVTARLTSGIHAICPRRSAFSVSYFSACAAASRWRWSSNSPVPVIFATYHATSAGPG